MVGVLSLAAGSGGRASAQGLWAQPYYRGRILFTLEQSALSTALTLVVGLPLAFLFAFREFPARRFLRAALTVPFIMPPLVVALGLRAGFADLGTDPGPVAAIVIAHVIYETSLVVRIVGASWETVPPALIESARTLGAGPGRVVRSVLAPLARRAIFASTLLSLLFTVTSFGIILLLGNGRVGTIETLIYEEAASFRPHYETAAVLGGIQLLLVAIVLILYLRTSSFDLGTYTPRPRHRAPRLGPAGLAVVAASVVLILGPFVVLLLSAFRFQGRWSLEPFRLLVDGPSLGSYTLARAAGNSLAFATLVAVLGIALAALQLFATRARPRLAAIWNAALLLPLGTSAVLLALGWLIVFDGSPLWDLRAQPARIVAVHLLVAFPFVTRVLQPAADAISPRLSEAARTLGADAWTSWRRVELPLLRPAIIAGLVFGFAVSLGEFGATLMLRRPEFTTLPVALYDAFGRPGAAYQAEAHAIALILAFVALVAFWAIEHAPRLRGAPP